jgi:hypothetical protein
VCGPAKAGSGKAHGERIDAASALLAQMAALRR